MDGRLRDPQGLLSLTNQSTVYNYGHDRLGSTTALVNSNQVLARTLAYDPWGESIGGTGTTYTAFQFTSSYLDSATGFYQMGARYYQPDWGRFTQVDPLPSKLITINRYAYSGCNPANYSDPTGLYCSVESAVIKSFAFVGAVVGYVGAVLTAPETLGGSLVIGSMLMASVATELDYLSCYE